jgi:hypothetical protein
LRHHESTLVKHPVPTTWCLISEERHEGKRTADDFTSVLCLKFMEIAKRLLTSRVQNSIARGVLKSTLCNLLKEHARSNEDAFAALAQLLS